MELRGDRTQQEILSQPEAWASTLDVTDDHLTDLTRVYSERASTVVFTGCGSTYYASLFAAAISSQLTGVVARGVPASELLLYPQTIYPAMGQVMLVALSRSGETTETTRAAQAFLEAGRGPVITLSCYPDQPLSRLGAVNIVLPSAQEESVVQTRAFTALALATVAVAAQWGDQDTLMNELRNVPAVGRRLLDQHIEFATQFASGFNFERCYFLGSGPQYGLACEMSLKMKEIALIPSEPFHFLEFRHEPKSIVTPEMLVIGLLSDAHRATEAAVISEVEALGGHTLTMGEQGADVSFSSDLSEPARGVFYMPVIQWLAVELAIEQGLNPDHPRNLDTVVRLALS